MLNPIDNFAEQCEFPKNTEHKLKEMLLFKDVYKSYKG